MTSLEAYERGKEIAKDMQDGTRDTDPFVEQFNAKDIDWAAVNEYLRKFVEE